MAKRTNLKTRNEATRQQALDLLTAEIKASPSGEVTTSAQRLGTRTGRAPQTVSGWLSAWTKEGLISLERLPGNRGIRVRLPSLHGEATSTEASVVSSSETGSETSSEAASVTGQEATQATDVEGSQEAHSEASSEAKLRKRRQPVRRRPKPEISLASVAGHSRRSVPAISPGWSTVGVGTVGTEAVSRRSKATLLAWTVRVFAVAAISLSVVMVGRHVASAETESPFDWWMLFLVSVLISLFKPVFGTLAEVLFSQRRYVAASLAIAVAGGALSYDATQLWAFRGGGLENKAATAEAAITARERDKARLENLIAEQRQLLAARSDTSTSVPVLSASAPVRVAATSTGEGPCQRVPAPWLRGRPEPVVQMEFGDCAAEMNAMALEADLARAKAVQSQAERAAAAAERRAARLAELPRLIAEAERALEARPVIAGARHGAESAANVLNWIPSMAGLTVASAHGVNMGWVTAFVLLIEIAAVFGFAFANLVQREREVQS